MRPLAHKVVFALIVLVASPLLGWGGQAHAGMLTTDTLSRSLDSSPFESNSSADWLAELYETPSGPSVSQAPDSAIDRDFDKTPLDQALESLGLFRSLVPARASVPATKLAKERQSQPLGLSDRPPPSPAGLASLFLSGPRTRLPDPLLSSLFRPPR